jgi:hypothetical protein
MIRVLRAAEVSVDGVVTALAHAAAPHDQPPRAAHEYASDRYESYNAAAMPK